jgi:hypothetical protein
MWTLAWKNFLKERVRLLISVGGVAFSVMLIVMLRGLFISYEHRAGRYFDHVGWQRVGLAAQHGERVQFVLACP